MPVDTSIISPNHPANSQRHAPSSSNYVFRQRDIKLNLTLGWEMEANHVPTRIPAGVEQISDGSVDGDGAEFVVLPAITRSPHYALGLLKELVHAPKLNTDRSCGFHVHVSTSNSLSIARMRQWAIATEHLAIQIEDLAFKAVPESRQENHYCKRIRPLISGTSFSASKYGNDRRYHWLNTVEMFRPGGIRTIEVRLLGHTHRWKYVLAWSLFCMELAARGWELYNHPFDVKTHTDALGTMLQRIAKEIKPLAKRHEPIPQWVYNGLKNFGMEVNAWDRPLAQLTEAEADIGIVQRRYYSDNQPEIENRNDEDDDNSCACGCGEEGRCYNQLHEDGDCDSRYCERCHRNGDCTGLPSCENCIEDAHGDGEDCQRTRCGICSVGRRSVTPARVSPISEGMIPPVIHDAVLYGTEVARSNRLDEAILLMQRGNAMLTDDEIVMSIDRMTFIQSRNIRALSVEDLVRLNRENGECLRRDRRAF